MNRTMKKEFKRYWAQVKPYLSCSRKSEKKFREETYQAFLEYHSNCSEEGAPAEIILGAPEELSIELLKRLDANEVRKIRTRNKRLLIISSIIAIIAVVITCLVVYLSKSPLWVTVEEETVIIQYPDGVEPPPAEEVAKMIQESRKDLDK